MKRVILAVAVIPVLSAGHAVPQLPDRSLNQPDLTRNQARARADQLFKRFDLNHDGMVTRDEAQQLGTNLMLERASTGRDQAPGIGGHTVKYLKRRFLGHQAVTKPEFEATLLDHFDQMDSNHDGVLTATERENAR